ncbi:MAG: dienelactone hydrolase family protein [Sandaracinaceae bacterium]
MTETTTETLDYAEGALSFRAFVAAPPGVGPCPAVLICHAWTGLSDSERGWAVEQAERGRVGVALDVYGEGRLGTTVEEKRALMGPLLEDRARLHRRLSAGIAAAKAHPRVDPDRVIVIGFCFGGLCALDVARCGEDVLGVVSFHGLLGPPPTPPAAVRARVLVLHGHDDPMVPPEDVLAFQAEMTTAGADWQVHVYGSTMHAFTNPAANDPGFGTVYSARADARARGSFEAFVAELF